MVKRKFRCLVCIDGSEHSDKAVKTAAYIAKNTGNEMTLVNVVNHPDVAPEHPYAVYLADLKQKSRKILDRSQKLFEGSGQKCETIILASENITNEILDYAESEKFDYIIIGTRGIGGLKRMFLGSIADKVIRHAHCPVIVIR